MTEILFCKSPISNVQLQTACGIGSESLLGSDCRPPEALKAYSPYIVTHGSVNDTDRALLTTLGSQPSVRALTHFALSFGGDNLVGLSALSKKLQDSSLGMMGTATSIYANRMGGFVGSVNEYQNSLLAYRTLAQSRSPLQIAAKQKAQVAFIKLQHQFRQELALVNSGVKARKGTPLTNFERGTNIARDSRNIARLRVANQLQAHDLVRFTQHAKLLGNGLAVIDFGSRIGNIRNEYRAGGEWERELFIESSSFAASAITGVTAANVGAAALTFLVAATPIGWVGLIVGGVAVAGVAAAASMGMNSAIKSNSGGWYDSIMHWLEIK